MLWEPQRLHHCSIGNTLTINMHGVTCHYEYRTQQMISQTPAGRLPLQYNSDFIHINQAPVSIPNNPQFQHTLPTHSPHDFCCFDLPPVIHPVSSSCALSKPKGHKVFTHKVTIDRSYRHDTTQKNEQTEKGWCKSKTGP